MLGGAIADWRNPDDSELTPWNGFANAYNADPGFVDYAAWLWRDSTGRQVIRGFGPDVGAFGAVSFLFADGFESGDTSAWTIATP